MENDKSIKVNQRQGSTIMFKKCKELERICFSSKDYEGGRLAFSEKRKPVFKGH